MDTQAAILALLTKMDKRVEALEAGKGKRKAKGKAASKARPTDTRTANERACAKLMRRIAWHEARLSGLGSKASGGQIRWNKSEIARLSGEVERMREHAVTVGETLPEDIKVERVRKALDRPTREVEADAAGIMGARKGDTADVAGELFTCSGGGWFRDSMGESIRRGDLIDLAS